MGPGKGSNLDPWIQLQQTQWQCTSLNGVNNMNFINPVEQTTSPAFPAHMKPFQQTTSGTIQPGMAGSKLMASHVSMKTCHLTAGGILPPGIDKFMHIAQITNQPSIPVNVPISTASRRRFIIFDQSGSSTRLLFSSVNPTPLKPDPVNSKMKHPVCPKFQEEIPVTDDVVNQSDETSISKGSKVAEMHEDTDEIDALLYSDSEDEEEALAGHYNPPKNHERGEEVASSGVPMKRRRLNDESHSDPSLVDTACSAILHGCQHANDADTSGDAELSFVEGKPSVGNGRESPRADDNDQSLKKDQIDLTLGVLRRIIPGGGEGKDATEVLDEAISYLKFLKAKIFGGAAL